MIYPSGDKLDQNVESRYALVVLAAKRAKQLREGAPKLIETNSTNPLTVALEEIAAGKVHYRLLDEAELLAREAEQREMLEAMDEEALAPDEMELIEDAKPSVAELLKIEDEEGDGEEPLVVEGEEDEEDETPLPDLLPIEPEAEEDEDVEPAADEDAEPAANEDIEPKAVEEAEPAEE